MAYPDFTEQADTRANIYPVFNNGQLKIIKCPDNAHCCIVSDMHIITNRLGMQNHAAVMPNSNPAS